MNSEASAIQTFPTAWEARPLAKVATVFTDGNWIESKDQAESGIRLVQTGNVGIGEFKDRSERARFIDEATFARLKCFEVMPGDLLISRLPDPVGRACIVPDTAQKMITAVDCSIVRVQPTTVDPKFLVYYSQTREYLRAVDDRCSGTTRRRISRKNLGDVPVPLPPLDEQKRIVAVLDQAFAALDRARALAEANLADARELFDNTLSETFSLQRQGWVEAAIGDCIRFIDYRGRTPDKTTSGLRLITAKNVKKGYLQDEPREFVAEDSYSDWMTRGIPVQGDVLFTTEAPLGNVAQLDTSDKVVFAQRVIIMKTDEKRVDSTFLKYMLLSSPVQKSIHAKATGATALGIKASLLKTIRISFPESIAEQCGIVEKIDMLQDETKRLEALYTRKLADLSTLRQSLLQKAFAGELT